MRRHAESRVRSSVLPTEDYYFILPVPNCYFTDPRGSMTRSVGWQMGEESTRFIHRRANAKFIPWIPSAVFPQQTTGQIKDNPPIAFLYH